MKLYCAPLDRTKSGTAKDELPVVLFGRADMPSAVSIGATALDRLTRKGLVAAPRAWDLLSIALSVIAADTAAGRGESPDGWTRGLGLRIAVSDPDFWASQKELLESQLRFLTTDIWSIDFVDGGVLPSPPSKRKQVKPAEDCVCLLSGGLDSLIGAADLAAAGRKPYLVSQVSRGDTKKQAYFAGRIVGGLQRVELNHNVVCPWKNELSQRARSVIFLAYAVLMASTLARYQNGQTVTLYICENGFISINPALTTARIGSLSTRTTHPLFLSQFQTLLAAADLNVKIENPYQFKTKGEMLREGADQNFLNKHAAETTSCGRFVRKYKHCGRCLPCLIRRAAFRAWGQSDTTGYVYDDLSKDDAERARFDDVRSAAVAVAEARAEGFDRWIRPRLSTISLANPALYTDVARRGLAELGDFLDAAGVK